MSFLNRKHFTCVILQTLLNALFSFIDAALYPLTGYETSPGVQEFYESYQITKSGVSRGDYWPRVWL